MKKFLKLFSILSLTFPWFFKAQLGDFLYLVVALCYCSVLGLSAFSPREKYWWWTLIEHFAFAVGFAMIVLPGLFEINRMARLIVSGAELAVVMFFGYSARMRLIGRPDPGLEIFLELKEKATDHLVRRTQEK